MKRMQLNNRETEISSFDLGEGDERKRQVQKWRRN